MPVYATLAMDVVFDSVIEPVRLLWFVKYPLSLISYNVNKTNAS